MLLLLISVGFGGMIEIWCWFVGLKCFRDAMIAEAIGLREVLSWVVQRQIQNVQIELDAKEIVNAFNIRKEDVSELGIILLDCYQLCNERHDILVSFVKRTTNVVAHQLARVAHFHASPCFCLETSGFLGVFLANDLINE